MPAHTLGIDIARALNTHLGVRDPGASGTIAWTNKGVALCEVTTATAESRALPGASSHSIGTTLLVFFKTDGGDLTITGAASSVVLTAAGSVAEFRVANNNGTKVWRLVSNSEVAGALPVDTSTQTTLPGSTDAEIGALEDAITEITTALVTAGIITDAYPEVS
jgi:hypothetical protein